MVTSIDDSQVATGTPRHVAIIMDGNNRWAKRRFMPGVSGHKAGVDSVREVVETSVKEGVEVLTLFAFSSENWRRPADEVGALMKLFILVLKNEIKKLHRNNIRLLVMGEKTGFSSEIQTLISEAETLTASNTAMTLVVAANYGGQWDIATAAKRMASDVQNGTLDVDSINEQVLHNYTSLHDLPAPDLLIRTGGEQRLSNFMLWQAAYAELYFTDLLWPDFKRAPYLEALQSFGGRVRRFGRTDDQLIEDDADKESKLGV